MTTEPEQLGQNGMTNGTYSEAQQRQAAFNYIMQQFIGNYLPFKGIWLPDRSLMVAHIQNGDGGDSAALQEWAKTRPGTYLITISPDAEKAQKQLETAGIGTGIVNLGVVFNPVPTGSPNTLGGLEEVLGNAPIVGALTSELHKSFLEKDFLGGRYNVTFLPNTVLEVSAVLKTRWSDYNPLFVATRKA